MADTTDPQVVQDCPLKKKSWIEIRLVGENDQPVPNLAYRIFLPDGTAVDGQLDSDGSARVDQIAPGTCVVTFPGLDTDAWEPM